MQIRDENKCMLFGNFVRRDDILSCHESRSIPDHDRKESQEQYRGDKDKNEKIITGIKRISKPGLRVYAGKDEIPSVLGGLGIAILSTNQGIVTDKEARKLQVGGEVLAFVW